METNKMTVAELIAYLQTQPQDLQVAYRCYSEQALLEADQIEIAEKCPPRPEVGFMTSGPTFRRRRICCWTTYESPT